MNQRILELLKQASKLANTDDNKDIDRTFDMIVAEKFAELIIKECARVQHKRFCEHGDVSWDILMEHFGVKP